MVSVEGEAMMHTRQDDALAHMAGVTTTAEGKLKPDWKSFSLPGWFQTKTYGNKSFTTADKQSGDKFYQTLAALTGKSVTSLFDNRFYPVPNGNWVAAIMSALQQSGATNAIDAAALASYAGGSGRYNGVFLTTSTGLSEGEYLSADDMYCESCDSPIRYSDALLRLKAKNPAAHDYIVALIGAKAAKRQMQADISLSKDKEKVIKKELEIVQKTAATAANVVKSVGEGVGSAFNLAAFLARNWLWIVGGTVVVGGYLLYRNRETVGRVAQAAITKRLP